VSREIKLTVLVLLVDESADSREFARTSLETQGFSVIEAFNGTDAIHRFHHDQPDLIILDVAIGQPDGFEVCRQIRKISDVPIIFLTALGEEIDQAMGLTSGANDYIIKPVSKTILGLRVRLHLRGKTDVTEESPTVLRADTLTLDLLTRELKVGDELVAITRTEFDFIHLLMQEPTHVFTRSQVSIAVGISDEFASEHLLDTHASRLRIKIKAAGGPRAISAVRGVGYRFI